METAAVKKDPYEEKLENLTDADITRILAEFNASVVTPACIGSHVVSVRKTESCSAKLIVLITRLSHPFDPVSVS